MLIASCTGLYSNGTDGGAKFVVYGVTLKSITPDFVVVAGVTTKTT